MRSLSKPNDELLTAASALAAYSLILWGMPAFAAVVSVLLAALITVVVLARLACSLLPEAKPERRRPEGEPMVSIHLPTYSEPPEVVIKTLDSLSNLDYDRYEVIVLDNNTPEPDLYEPVRRHCERLGPKFRFYHYDDVDGAKAGALNISLQLSHPQAEFIVVLDADYTAFPGMLQAGVSYFVRPEVGLVQFPQAYRNSQESCGLTLEYKHFFDVYMNLGNQANTVLSTGTAAFLRRSALLKAGGWRGDTLTEDAELGVRLHLSGSEVVYVPQVVAAGLMPTDLKSLREQRRRWIVGNAQSIGAVLRSSELSLKQKVSMLLQLTAWISPLLVPFWELSLAGVVSLFRSHPALDVVIASSLLAIFVYLIGTLLFFLNAGLRAGFSPVTATKGFLAHLGMLVEASICWCELFFESKFKFVRTDKFIHTSERKAALASLGTAVVLTGLGFQVIAFGNHALTGLWGLFTAFAVGRAYLRWNLHQIRARTIELRQEEKETGEPHLDSVARIMA